MVCAFFAIPIPAAGTRFAIFKRKKCQELIQFLHQG